MNCVLVVKFSREKDYLFRKNYGSIKKVLKGKKKVEN